MTQVSSELDIDVALQHPRSFFAEPKEVVAHPTLSREMKIAILREWELDARRLSASEGEGFCGGEESMLGRVEDAITLVQRQA
jgi:hypothetical protein